jgi:hypothetical protein
LLDLTATGVAGGHWQEHVYAASPRTTEDLVVRLQADVAMVDANMLRHI